MQPQQAINGAPATPPVYSLLQAAPAIQLPDADWTAGFKWTPELTGTANTQGVVRIDCIGDTSAGMNNANAGSFVTGDPFLVYAADVCSTMGYRAHDYAGRARRLLAATASYQIAKELWEGAASSPVTALGNRWLTDTASDEMTTAGVTPQAALGLLEQGIAFYGHGRRGMLHCTPQVLVEWHAAYGLEKAGNVWVTPMGNIVVADAGYTGSGPGNSAAGATQWAYATDVIEILTSSVALLPGYDPATQEAEFFAEALDRTVNKMIVYATQAAAFRWDRQIHVAAQITLPIPAYGGN